MNHFFQKAKPVFIEGAAEPYNQFAGFRSDVWVEAPGVLKIAVTARSFYRLYVDGKMAAHGPARTAHGYVRVDELEIPVEKAGVVRLAAEVAAYDTPDHVSNDITLEPGLFWCEVQCAGKVLAATGAKAESPWLCRQLTHRRSRAEMLSHCREVIEVYDLGPDTLSWVTEDLNTYQPCRVLDEQPLLLPRGSRLPAMETLPVLNLVELGGIAAGEEKRGPDMADHLNETLHTHWYGQLTERVVKQARRDENVPFQGKLECMGEGWRIEPGKQPACYLQFDLGNNYVGFLGFDLEVEKACVFDIFHQEGLEDEGRITQTNNMVRYCLEPGRYRLLTFEPYVLRHLKLVFRTQGTVCLNSAVLVTYWYPDSRRGSFLCSDGDVNRIYDASRRTLLMNTLDIFMDCAERERGGWLCDSLWTARAAWQMLGDVSVEKAFLQNFMLTDPAKYGHAFFPEVFPSHHDSYEEMAGITTWSFWLILEFCEYYRRTGDRELLEQSFPRVEAFIRGTRDFIGESGLLENMPAIFLDWSQSNQADHTQPICLPANALYAYMLCEIGKLYGREEWVKWGEAIRGVLRSMGAVTFITEEKLYPDTAYLENGALKTKEYITEAALYTDIWSELFDRNSEPGMIQAVVNTMGPAPKTLTSPSVGRANLFIGLCIRLDMLAKLGEYGRLLEELRAIFLPQLNRGPGTLYENVNTSGSLSHGFNAHVGVHLTRDILGLGEVHLQEKRVRVAPHPCGLQWAKGCEQTPCGPLAVSWNYSPDGRAFRLACTVPPGWSVELSLPQELRGWLWDGDSACRAMKTYAQSFELLLARPED